VSGRRVLQRLADAGLIPRIDAPPDLATDQDTDHGTADGGDGTATPAADLIAEQSADDSLQARRRHSRLGGEDRSVGA
jgi:hypothetical protein